MRERIIAWAVAIAAIAPFCPLAFPGDSALPYFEWSDYTAMQLPIHP